MTASAIRKSFICIYNFFYICICVCIYDGFCIFICAYFFVCLETKQIGWCVIKGDLGNNGSDKTNNGENSPGGKIGEGAQAWPWLENIENYVLSLLKQFIVGLSCKW